MNLITWCQLWAFASNSNTISVSKFHTLGTWKVSCVKQNPALWQLTVNREIWHLIRKRLLVTIKGCLYNKLLLLKREGMSLNFIITVLMLLFHIKVHSSSSYNIVTTLIWERKYTVRRLQRQKHVVHDKWVNSIRRHNCSHCAYTK